MPPPPRRRTPSPSQRCRCTGPFTMISTSIHCRTAGGRRTTPAAPPGRKRATGAAKAPTSSARPPGTASSRSMSTRVMPDERRRRSGSTRSAVRDGLLSITASRTPPALKEVLFNNEYVSGILTTQGSFAQKFGYFEIRAKIPVGQGVWPAFWMLADNGGWPPEIDMIGRPRATARRPRDDDALADSGHRRRAILRLRFHGAGRARPLSTTTACCGCRTG